MSSSRSLHSSASPSPPLSSAAFTVSENLSRLLPRPTQSQIVPPMPSTPLFSTQPLPPPPNFGNVQEGHVGLSSSTQLYLYLFSILFIGILSGSVIRWLRRRRGVVAGAIVNDTGYPPHATRCQQWC
ncbi:hypothetical protein GGX14DRAFT_397017 [Mycena pura]|uniref:Uncharacterized protein n=1 Tax=Mycena pura TaxID=153505 RepID=A0AAD6V9C2_9AGAR|nr:hypothetical protein GGX14DRAFT_397017 [Mycena pura]